MSNHRILPFPIFGEPPEEILALAEEQMVILERRFPDYKYTLYKSSGGCSISVETAAPQSWLDPGSTVLEASFSSSRVNITLFGDVKLERQTKITEVVQRTVVDYADPKFTENVLSNILASYAGKHNV